MDSSVASGGAAAAEPQQAVWRSGREQCARCVRQWQRGAASRGLVDRAVGTVAGYLEAGAGKTAPIAVRYDPEPGKAAVSNFTRETQIVEASLASL